jgi:hypothetical protein
LIGILNNASSNGISIAELKTILLDPTTEYALAFEPLRLSYWQAYAVAMEDINGWLTARQRQHAATRLRKYAQIAARLGNQG